jgi:CRP-like cAMP-binding protein
MYIILEGNHDVDRFFIIQKGFVRLTRGGEIIQQESGDGNLKAGDFFGVVSTMSYHSQIETAQAMTDVTLLAVERTQFEGLIYYNAPIAMKIIQQFSRRMRYLNNELTQLPINSDSFDYDMSVLYNVAEHYRKHSKNPLAVYAYKRYAQCYPNGKYLPQAVAQLKALAQFDKPNFKPGVTPFIKIYPKENPIFAEGESGEELYIIQSGSVKITKVVNDNEVILAILKPGDIFGEMSLLESKPRSATAIAYENTTLMTVLRKNFELMSTTQPQIISKLTQLLANRIWFSYKQLENATIKDPVGRCYDCLLIHIEKARFPIQAGTAYAFDFGPSDLIKMAGIPENETKNVIAGVLSNNKILIGGDGCVFVSDVLELLKLSEYYKKMRQRSLGPKKK